MFDLSWSHILIFLVVALVVVGPKDMPRLLRIVGQWVAKARGMANEFRSSFEDMAKHSELDELRKEINALRYDRPLSEFEKTMNAPVEKKPAPPEPQVQMMPIAPAVDAPVSETAPEHLDKTA